MMRKIKSNNNTKKEIRKMSKQAPIVLESKEDKDLGIIIVLMYNIIHHSDILWKIADLSKQSYNIKLNNEVITEDSFAKELKLIDRLLMFIIDCENISKETEKLMFRYVKNKELKELASKDTYIEYAKMKSYMNIYLSTIEIDEYMLFINQAYMKLLATVKTLKEKLNKINNSILLRLFDKKYIRTLRTLTTQLYNLIPHSLMELTGDANVTEELIKDLMDKSNSLETNIKETIDLITLNKNKPINGGKLH